MIDWQKNQANSNIRNKFLFIKLLDGNGIAAPSADYLFPFSSPHHVNTQQNNMNDAANNTSEQSVHELTEHSSDMVDSSNIHPVAMNCQLSSDVVQDDLMKNKFIYNKSNNADRWSILISSVLFGKIDDDKQGHKRTYHLTVRLTSNQCMQTVHSLLNHWDQHRQTYQQQQQRQQQLQSVHDILSICSSFAPQSMLYGFIDGLPAMFRNRWDDNLDRRELILNTVPSSVRWYDRFGHSLSKDMIMDVGFRAYQLYFRVPTDSSMDVFKFQEAVENYAKPGSSHQLKFNTLLAPLRSVCTWCWQTDHTRKDCAHRMSTQVNGVDAAPCCDRCHTHHPTVACVATEQVACTLCKQQHSVRTCELYKVRTRRITREDEMKRQQRQVNSVSHMTRTMPSIVRQSAVLDVSSSTRSSTSSWSNGSPFSWSASNSASNSTSSSSSPSSTTSLHSAGQYHRQKQFQSYSSVVARSAGSLPSVPSVPSDPQQSVVIQLLQQQMEQQRQQSQQQMEQLRQQFEDQRKQFDQLLQFMQTEMTQLKQQLVDAQKEANEWKNKAMDIMRQYGVEPKKHKSAASSVGQRNTSLVTASTCSSLPHPVPSPSGGTTSMTSSTLPASSISITHA
jgi:hypothetical protein